MVQFAEGLESVVQTLAVTITIDPEAPAVLSNASVSDCAESEWLA
jgi:hypothetical protein